MKRNVLQTVISFIFRYIWVFCLLLIVMEISSVLVTSTLLMKQATIGILRSASDEIAGRVDGVLRLLQGFATDERISDTSKPMFDRAIQMEPYRESYGLYMLALTDENIDVLSSDEKEPPKEKFSLAGRDYLQKLYSTGQYQITDAFLAGADGVTMNYTIAVPILEGNTVKGSVFGSIYFQDIQDRLSQNADDPNRRFYLLGKNGTFMSGGDDALYGKTIPEAAVHSYYLGTSAEDIQANILGGVPGSCWQYSSNGLCYITYEPIERTNWTIAYQVTFSSVVRTLLPILIFKSIFYCLICMTIAVLGRRYLLKNLYAVNHLLEKVTTMQRELFTSEQADYDNLLELTQKGLTDQLTGLSTRAVMFQKMTQFLEQSNGAVFFVDLDDLKRINDCFGHEAGDCALIHVAQSLRALEQTYDGVTARYGGDEFLLVVKDIDEKKAREIGDKLCHLLHTAIHIQNRSITVHGSVGIALFPDNGTKLEELISKADLALYTAKQFGKNRFAFYEEEILDQGP